MTRSGIVLAVVLAFAGSVSHVSAAELMRATGDFTAEVDFTTLSLTPIGNGCLLEVEGVLSFEGTLVGLASGNTRALVSAPCGDVAVSPPGTFEDIFSAKLEFAGAVDGRPALADMTYIGATESGGEIEARFRLSNGLRGVMKVRATVAVGGSYRGVVTFE